MDMFPASKYDVYNSYIADRRMKNQRKTKRFLEKNKAVINFSLKEDALKQGSNMAMTWDLSLDGARLFTYKYFPVDTKLILSMDLAKSSQMVKLWAQVKWVKELNNVGEFELGVEFIHSLETIPNLMKHLYGHIPAPPKELEGRKEASYPVDMIEAQ